jgi:hypothetical protein
MEAVWAMVAVLVTAAGGLYTTVYHSGSSNGVVTQQIAQIQAAQTATDAHVAKHDDQLASIQIQQGANAQALKDIQDTVHDIQDQVHKAKK